MEEKTIPYIVHEGILWRMERTQKRLVIIIVILIVLLAASWIGFIRAKLNATKPGIVNTQTVTASDVSYPNESPPWALLFGL